MKLTFESKVKNNRIDEVELQVDDQYINKVKFNHKKKDVESEINPNLNVEQLESIYAYQNNFNRIAQMLFMDVGYAFFQLIDEVDPKKAEALKKELQNKSKNNQK